MLNIIANNKEVIKKAKEGKALTKEERIALAQIIIELNSRIESGINNARFCNQGHDNDCTCGHCQTEKILSQ